jgi:hypothetical protein
MAYENNDDLAKDCMVSAVQFKQNSLRAWFSPEGKIPNSENQKAVDKLRGEINDIREHYKFHFDVEIDVAFTPFESPEFGNYTV